MLYIKQLDSVRAIAVFLVILWHWIPRDSFINQFPTGPFGVHIFFVLSGFLITQILLKNRIEAIDTKHTKTKVLKSFYIRRALRIFPVYYLTIFLTILLRDKLKIILTVNELIASATYISNFYFFSINSFTDATSHFWSLAVEEQFYLAWPLLMLFIPIRYLLHCIICFIGVGLVSQTLISGSWMGNVLPHTCFDGLGLGGLIAWIAVYRRHLLQNFYKGVRLSAILSIGIILTVFFSGTEIKQERFLHSLIGAWIITYILISHNKKAVLISLLSNRFLVYIGKMSYGIYLYHVLYLYFGLRLWYKYAPKFVASMSKGPQSWMFLAVNIWGLFFIC